MPEKSLPQTPVCCQAQGLHQQHELSHHETHVICTAFAKGMTYPSCLIGDDVLWRDSRKRPNVFRPENYQHPHRETGIWCPAFTRFSINVSHPWKYRKGYWAENENLDAHGPNYMIEITVLPSEAKSLAEWLPLWLRLREGGNSQPLSDPPRGLDGLLRWHPSRGHVYHWSSDADAAYQLWQKDQAGITNE